ncbi:prepilin peptidase [Zavarzinia aquatilis]|uniref:Prepilin leader peptidase/N-methyltransferase n=1 Tax=Zavarzinia aquatilis TaxID=2211142 RepID=A0A317EC98_9PROT|nr:A24 family peptidase [Zavarzinia aquatilis]PWR22815.1 hypothetical protein DKG74_10325 [Zavarzinia aquatilis]
MIVSGAMMPAICDGFDDILTEFRLFGALLPAFVGWLAAALWGLMIGSFATVAMERWPAIIEGRMPASALWYPGSRCPPCGRPLTWAQAMPLIGWLALRGHCPCGAQRVPARYPLVELGGVVFVLAAALLAPAPADRAVAFVLVASVLYVLAVVDARSGYLPDALTLGLLWAGLLASALGPCGLDAIAPGDAIAGAATGWLVMALVGTMARLRLGHEALARGDWKLVAAVGAWGGVLAVFHLLLLGSVAALALAPLLDRFRLGDDADGPRGVPLGPGFALAALPVLAGLVPSLDLFG